MEEKIKIYKTTAKAILDAQIPFNSTFDETLKNEDLRIIKTKFIDESEEEFTDFDFEEMIGPLGIDTDEEWDIQCLTAHITDPDPQWESIIQYPTFTAGSKTRNMFHRIQDKIREIYRMQKKSAEEVLIKEFIKVPQKIIRIGNSVGITFPKRMKLKPGDWVHIKEIEINRY